jgi:hypothetical protein
MNYRLIVAAVVFVGSTCVPWPAHAADSPSLPPHSGILTLDDLSHVGEVGRQLFGEVVDRTRRIIHNYVEIEAGHRPGMQEGTEGGNLTLRVYPKGKTESDEHYTAEAWFRLSAPEGKDNLSYDFQVSPPQTIILQPKDYL